MQTNMVKIPKLSNMNSNVNNTFISSALRDNVITKYVTFLPRDAMALCQSVFH